MLKTMSKISVLTMISALFVFAFSGAAFAEETDEELVVQPVQMEEPDLPVGGWAPAEAVYVSDDLVVNNSSSSDKKRKSNSKNGSSLDPIFTDEGEASTGYDALDSGQRELYEAINEVAIAFMNAEEDLQSQPVKEDGQYVERFIIGEIDYTKAAIAGDTIAERKQNALKAYYAYDYDHPAYYWLSNLILFNDEKLYPCTEEEYASVEARQTINEMVIKGVKGYAAVAGKGTDTLDKVALVHDQIVNDIDYAYKKDGKTPVEEKWAHSVHGVFDPQYKHAVCEGYADAFALIMNCLEIPNYYIVGTAGDDNPSDGAGHAWNAVYDDAAEWYLYMDLTWDDCGEDGYSYEYFGMPKTDFEKSHHEYTEGATQAKEWLYDIDKVGEDYNDYNDSFAGTYYNVGGFYYDGSTDVNDLIIATKKKAVRAGEWVSVMCPLEDDSVLEVAEALGVDDSYYTVTYRDYDCAYLTARVSTPVYKWSSDYSQVTAIYIYRTGNGDVESETETVNTTSEESEATCTEDGRITYTAAFDNENIDAKEKIIVTQEALGHDWDEPTYDWADDNSAVTAKRECKRKTGSSCTEIEAVQPTVDASEEATCTEAGYGTFSATFKNTAFKEQTKEGTIKALGHDWGAPTYTWAPDYKTVTAKRVCSHATGNSCTEIETANATSKITRAATYTAKGQTTYTAAFANPIFRAQAKTVTNIPMLAKKANPMKVKATAKTVKVKALKKKALTVVPLKVTSAKGKVTYKVVGGNAKSKKALKLNAKTGKVTVKKKTKKGKYQIKVKVTAAGATAYKALSKTVKVTVNAK